LGLSRRYTGCPDIILLFYGHEVSCYIYLQEHFSVLFNPLYPKQLIFALQGIISFQSMMSRVYTGEKSAFALNRKQWGVTKKKEF
jgi:hypothetical protein